MMESISINGTVFDNTTNLNDTVAWAYWQNLNISYQLRTLLDCSMAYSISVHNPDYYIILHPWSEITPVEQICKVRKVLSTVVFYVGIALGIPGNILSMLTILTLPKSTGAFYVAVLAGADLFTLLAKIFETALTNNDAYTTATCKISRMLSNYSGTYANWVLVLICFERLITVKFPLKKNYYFTLKRAYLSTFLLAVFLFPVAVVYLWIFYESLGSCAEEESAFQAAWKHLQGLLYSYLPAIFLFIMVVMIARELKKIQRDRKSIFCSDEASAGSLSDAQTRERLREQAKVERSITIMLLFASIVFIILTVPICIMVSVFHEEFSSPLREARKELAFTVAKSLTFMSHAVNFFVYFISTSRFRDHLFSLLRRPCPARDNGRSGGNAHYTTAPTQEVCL